MSTIDQGAAIDDAVAAAVARQELPGLSIAVASGDDIVLMRGYGLRNVGERLPAGPDTIYSIASISKQFTVAALMQLVERGRLRLDDPVTRYLPWLDADPGVRVRHLCTHTSGLRDYFPLDDLDRIGFVSATPREIAERAAAGGPAFAPGTDYQYCNTGYVLLGAILEIVAETSYADYLRTQIFEPLGMTRTGVDDTPAIRGDLAIGYTSYALGPWELARDYHPSWEFATGGLFSTVADMLRWNRALRAGAVVSRDSLREMTTPTVLADGTAVAYGLGLAVGDVGGLREVRHTGGLPGMSTDNATYPDVPSDVIVFVNADGVSTYATVTRRVLAIVRDDPSLVTAPPPVRRAGTLAVRPEAEGWLRAAAAGGIDDLPLTAKFRRFLRDDHRAALRALGERGAIGAISLVDANRRAPETTASYRIDTAAGPLGASLTVRDDGTIAGLTVVRWDERG